MVLVTLRDAVTPSKGGAISPAFSPTSFLQLAFLVP